MQVFLFFPLFRIAHSAHFFCLLPPFPFFFSVGSLSHGDILLVLISGGGSALLTLPQSPITLEDVLFATKALSAEGATITQLNMMRRHLSMVKGITLVFPMNN